MNRNPIKLMAIVLAGVAPVAAQMYHQVNLVSDVSGLAAITDPLLINPWGVSFSPTSPFWVSNAGSSTSTLYAVTGSSAVSKAALEVHTPTPPSGQAWRLRSGDIPICRIERNHVRLELERAASGFPIDASYPGGDRHAFSGGLHRTCPREQGVGSVPLRRE